MINFLINVDHSYVNSPYANFESWAVFIFLMFALLKLFPTACYFFLQRVLISPVHPLSQFSFQGSFVKFLVQCKEKYTTS